MKKTFLFLLAVIVTTATFAQMQVWSNGTIIFSHDQTDVDSISFGSPMQVQTRMQSATAPSSLAGSVYVSSLSGSGYGSSTNSLYTLCFLDESNGYYTYNAYGKPNENSNKMIAFTYSISGSDITINIQGANKTGKIIGKNGIVISNWYTDDNQYYHYPATFLNYNR